MSVDRRLESHEWLPGRPTHPMAVMVGTVGALSAFYHDCRGVKAMNESERALAPCGSSRSCRRSRRWRTATPWACPYVAPRRGQVLRGEFAEHVLRVAARWRRVRRAPRCLRESIGCLPAAARGPRAERVDVDGAHRPRRGESVCVRRRGHRESVGPDARRRQTAARIRMLREIGTKERIPEFLGAGQGQERPVQAHGLWPPRGRSVDGVKKLALHCHRCDGSTRRFPPHRCIPKHRPAGQGDEEAGFRLHSRVRAAQLPGPRRICDGVGPCASARRGRTPPAPPDSCGNCSTSLSSSRGPRRRRLLRVAASCFPTWAAARNHFIRGTAGHTRARRSTATRASRSRRWASRSRCSRASFGRRPVGELGRSGSRRWPSRSAASRGRAGSRGRDAAGLPRRPRASSSGCPNSSGASRTRRRTTAGLQLAASSASPQIALRSPSSPYRSRRFISQSARYGVVRTVLPRDTIVPATAVRH